MAYWGTELTSEEPYVYHEKAELHIAKAILGSKSSRKKAVVIFSSRPNIVTPGEVLSYFPTPAEACYTPKVTVNIYQGVKFPVDGPHLIFRSGLFYSDEDEYASDFNEDGRCKGAEVDSDSRDDFPIPAASGKQNSDESFTGKEASEKSLKQKRDDLTRRERAKKNKQHEDIPDPKLKGPARKCYRSGLVVEDLCMPKPNGKRADRGREVSIWYSVKIWNGETFESNFGLEPYKFQLGAGEALPGWEVGIQGMRVGERRQLTIPPWMGYGTKGTGSGSDIPPNSWLVFEVELVNVS